MPITQLTESFESNSEQTGSSLIWILVIAIFLNVFLPGGFKYMLFLIRTLQLILHMPMMSIVIPGNAQTFNSLVFPIVMFDVLD